MERAFAVLYAMAAANEIWAGIIKRSALISLATVRLMRHERERTRFNHEKERARTGDSVSTGRGDSQRHHPLVPTEQLAENPGAEEDPAAWHLQCRKREVRSVL
jgi:hypothetical protein